MTVVIWIMLCITSRLMNLLKALKKLLHPENINMNGDLEHNPDYAKADETTEDIEEFTPELKIEFQFRSQDINVNGDLEHYLHHVVLDESTDIRKSATGSKIEPEFHPVNVNLKRNSEDNPHCVTAKETAEDVGEFALDLKIEFLFQSEDINVNGDLEHNLHYVEADEYTKTLEKMHHIRRYSLSFT